MYFARGAGGPVSVLGAFGTHWMLPSVSIWVWLLWWTIIGALIILWGVWRISLGTRAFKREREIAARQKIH